MIGILNTPPARAAWPSPIFFSAPPPADFAQKNSAQSAAPIRGAEVQPLDLTKEQPPNEFNQEIATEEALYRRAIRSTAGKWNNGTPGSTTL